MRFAILIVLVCSSSITIAQIFSFEAMGGYSFHDERPNSLNAGVVLGYSPDENGMGINLGAIWDNYYPKIPFYLSFTFGENIKYWANVGGYVTLEWVRNNSFRRLHQFGFILGTGAGYKLGRFILKGRYDALIEMRKTSSDEIIPSVIQMFDVGVCFNIVFD